MIFIDLYRSILAEPRIGKAETIFEWQFDTWKEALAWYDATKFKTTKTAGGKDCLRECLQEGVDGDNTYIGHEIELLDKEGGFTHYGFSIEGHEHVPD